MMDAAGKRPDSLADSAPSDTFLAMISNDSPTDLGAMQDLWQTRPNGGSQQDLWARPPTPTAATGSTERRGWRPMASGPRPLRPRLPPSRSSSS